MSSVWRYRLALVVSALLVSAAWIALMYRYAYTATALVTLAAVVAIYASNINGYTAGFVAACTLDLQAQLDMTARSAYAVVAWWSVDMWYAKVITASRVADRTPVGLECRANTLQAVQHAVITRIWALTNQTRNDYVLDWRTMEPYPLERK